MSLAGDLGTFLWPSTPCPRLTVPIEPDLVEQLGSIPSPTFEPNDTGGSLSPWSWGQFTIALSNKVENLAHAVSLYDNFCRIHESLRIKNENGRSIKRTPSMDAGFADHARSLIQLAAFLDEPLKS
jgi:hypothetical protein